MNYKIAYLIASKDFRDAEYFIPKKILEAASCKITTVSDQPGMAYGVDTGQAKIDLTLDQVVIQDFQAVVMAGGSGAIEHLDHEKTYYLIQQALADHLLIAAICIAPTILAKAQALVNRQATVWTSVNNQDTIQILKDHGARYVNQAVVVDHNVITANGPQAAREFGQAILSYLTNLDKNQTKE